jgi:hypothetical protein
VAYKPITKGDFGGLVQFDTLFGCEPAKGEALVGCQGRDEAGSGGGHGFVTGKRRNPIRMKATPTMGTMGISQAMAII